MGFIINKRFSYRTTDNFIHKIKLSISKLTKLTKAHETLDIT